MKQLKRTLGNRQQKAGFSLMELVLVVGLIGAMMGGVWSYASAAHQSQKLAIALQNVALTVDAVRDSYGSRVSIDGGIGAVSGFLSGANALPADFSRTANTTCAGVAATYADNAWATSNADVCGTFRVCGMVYPVLAPPGSYECSTTAAAQNTNAQSFAIEFTNVDYGTCMSLAQTMSTSQPTGLEDIAINNNSSANSGTHVLPATPNTVSNWCGAGNANIVDFIYTLRRPSS